MARPIRIEYPGAVYHITARGNAGWPIYQDEKDRELFLELLGDITEQFEWQLYAYCLMGNHYHLLLETPGGELSRGMQKLNSVYTQKFNRKHNRTGHIFQGRFKSLLVEKENYLLELCRYISLNPVRAGMVKDPSDWHWSSYRATIGEDESPKWLETEWILNQFGSEAASARRRYADFIAEGMKSQGQLPIGEERVALGSESFKTTLEEAIKGKRQLAEVPRYQRMLGRPALEEIFKDISHKQERDGAIYKAAREHGYRQREIGDYLGLHHSTISKIVLSRQN
ncbi:MAG: transposase [bacterium]|nr:transposase [bacterium]